MAIMIKKWAEKGNGEIKRKSPFCNAQERARTAIGGESRGILSQLVAFDFSEFIPVNDQIVTKLSGPYQARS
jgi:hypothetical protein